MSGSKLNPGHIWKLIRGNNLIFIALTQYLFKYFILDIQIQTHSVFFSENAVASQRILFFLLVLSTVFIAAAGYVINDIYDIKTDKINKPDKVIVGRFISEKQAKTLYYSFNVIGILLGFIAFFSLGKPSLITIQLLASMMLYLYAIKHQCNGFLGNLFVSFSTALVVLTVWIFEFYILLISGSSYLLDDLTSQILIFGYAGFAFVFTLLREWTKDLEDIEGDTATGCRSFMNKQGIVSGKKIIAATIVISSLLIGIFQYMLFQHAASHRLFNALFITLIVVNLVSALPQALKAKEKQDFKKLSSIFKIIMAAGILYMVFFILI